MIGIGINVHARSFPADIAWPATSLVLAGATSPDRSALFIELASALSRRTGALENGDPSTLIDAFASRDALAGRAITIDGAPAIAIGIERDGALRIRRPDGTEGCCIAGDVRLESTSDLQGDR